MDFSQERQIKYIDKIMHWCFMGLVFILPIAHTMSIRSVFMFLPMALWLYKMVLKKEILFVRNQMTLPLTVFAIVATLSVFTAINPKYTLRELRGEMITDFLLFFLILNNIRDMKQVNNIVLSLLIGSFVQGIYSSLHYFSMDWNLLNYDIKVGGLTGGYISYSVFLISILPFVAYKIVDSSGSKRFFFIGLIFINLFMLYLTHQRGAWIALIVQVFTFFLLLRRWILCTAVVGVIAVTLFLIPSGILYHGQKGINVAADNALNTDNTINSRIALWRFTLKEIGQHPFTGIGFGRHSFSMQYQQFRKTDLWHAHNTFLNLTIQLGFQGLLAFAFILYRLARTYWIALKEAEGETYYFFLASLISTVGFFVRNMFDDHYVDDNAQMFWVLTGLSVAVFINIKKLTYSSIFSEGRFK